VKTNENIARNKKTAKKIEKESATEGTYTERKISLEKQLNKLWSGY
jgi:hypothetical protein